jgi:hypothetical protein
VMDMQHLVRCIEYMFFYSTVGTSTLFGGCMLPSELRSRRYGEKEIENWKDRFYRAMYRMLLAGAVLARPYMEPFFQAQDQENDPTIFDVNHLRRFSVYNFDVLDESDTGKWRNSEYENAFGPLASWVVEDGKARGIRNSLPVNSRIKWCTDSGELGSVHELMCMLTAYEHLACKFSPYDQAIEAGNIQGFRKVSIVLFGDFHVKEVRVPVRIEETKDTLLVATSNPLLKNSEGKDLFPSNIFVETVLETLQLEHSRSGYFDISHGEHPEPPPLFDFWHFALRRYLDLGFCERSFWQWRECNWWISVGGGDAFNSAGWLPVEGLQVGRVSWHPRW